MAQPGTPLVILARQADTTVAAIKDLNPHLKLDRTRNDRAMVVRVPLKPGAPAGPGVDQRSGILIAD